LKKIGLITLGLAIVAITATTGGAMAGPPFGNPADVEDGNHLWTHMAKARLVGKNSLHAMPYETPPPHGSFVESLDGMLTVNGHTGVVIVKKNFGKRGETTKQQVADHPDKYMTSVTVMFKREKGYDPENKDWFWAKYGADGKLLKNPKGMALAGRVAKGAEKGCIACHAGAPGGDMVYIHDRYAQ